MNQKQTDTISLKIWEKYLRDRKATIKPSSPMIAGYTKDQLTKVLVVHSRT